jgi:hypothetical protein
MRKRLALKERFWAKVNKNGPVIRPELGPCWVWTAALGTFGYGAIALGGKFGGKVDAHRAAWFIEFGHWPAPCCLHHCDNQSCVKACSDEFGPAHLFEGSQADNMRDAARKGRNANQQKTHCPAGHPYDEANTRWWKRGRKRGRVCRTCERESSRLWQRSRRGSAGYQPKTHCLHGHPFDEANTLVYTYHYGRVQICRTCNRERCRLKRLKARRRATESKYQG